MKSKNNRKIILIAGSTILLPFLILAYYIPPEEEVLRVPTEITYQGSRSGQYSDQVSLKAKLVNKLTQKGLKGKEVTFTLEAQSATATTDGQGIAQTNLVLNQGAATYTILAIFGGDRSFSGSSTSTSFQILKEDTSLTYTGPLSGISGATVVFQARLSELDGEIGNLSEKRINFTLGNRTASAITDSQGQASTPFSLAGFSAGTYSLTTKFEGDALYLPSSDADNFEVIVRDPINGNGGNGGTCFIATAAYGSHLAPELDILRKFRDQYLLTNQFGLSFVSKYYQYSPPLADYIREREYLKKIIRVVLRPLIELAKLAVY